MPSVFRRVLPAFIVLAWICLTSASAQQFVEELIEIHVHDTYCTLEGTYMFGNQNASNADWSVFYPLLYTRELPFPDSIHVLNDSKNDSVPFARAENGVSFPVVVPPLTLSSYRVFYRQRTPAQRMEYILTTTQQWGRALEKATFVIVIPDSLRLTGTSIPVDHVERRTGERVFHIQRINFMPNENLIIHWKRRIQ